MKYYTDIAKKQLKTWLKHLLNPKNDAESSALFEDDNFEKFAANYSRYKTIDKDKAWAKFEDQLELEISQKSQSKSRVIYSLYRYAAAAVVVFFVGYYFVADGIQNSTSNLGKDALAYNSDVLTLRTVGGKVEEIKPFNHTTLEKNNGGIIAFQKGKELDYSQIEFSAADEKIKQELLVPNGESFRVVLSDGTKVYCDAGTKLSFPVKFPANGERRVQLSGQAFFDVVSDAAHPFVVTANSVDVRALGTQFNVIAYEEMASVKTVLIEGKVNMRAKTSKKEVKLTPGHMATFNKNSKRIRIKEVNTYDHTAWISQKMIFKKVAFSSILKTLERKFKVQIINKKADLENEVFTAKFTNESIEEILKAFQINHPFDFKIEDKTVVIN